MTRTLRATAAVVALAVVLGTPGVASTYPSGSPGGYSGDNHNSDGSAQTCTTCHTSFALNSGTGGVSVDVPSSVAPGQTVAVTVTVTNATPPASGAMPRQGFETAARDASGALTGTFAITDASTTRTTFGADRSVTHNASGSTHSSWTFDWTAPDAPATVTFYTAGNAANGDGSSDGDHIYATTQTVIVGTTAAGRAAGRRGAAGPLGAAPEPGPRRRRGAPAHRRRRAGARAPRRRPRPDGADHRRGAAGRGRGRRFDGRPRAGDVRRRGRGGRRARRAAALGREVASALQVRRAVADTSASPSRCPVPDLPPDLVPPAAAGVRLVARRLGAATVHLYAEDAVGQLRLAAADGPHTADLAALAEMLGASPSVLDVSGVVTGVRFAVGQRAGAAALMVLGVDRARLDAAWDADFADAVALAAGLAVPAGAAGPDDAHARLLHTVATHPGTFDERLEIGLRGLAEALALDGAALAFVDDGVWTPEVTVDPRGVLPVGPVPVAALPCSITVRADGPVAMEEAGSGFGAYLGAPVFSDGRTVGTLVAAGREPRETPFSPADRALAESLARWAGSAIGGRTAARRLADREAALSAFVDRAPVAMGLVTYDSAASDDFRFVTVNTAAAELLGDDAAALAGRAASDAGIAPRTRRAWALGCRRALAGAADATLAPFTLDIETSSGARIVAVTLGRLDVHDADGRLVSCVSFVAEDVTEREQSLLATAEGLDQAEAVAADQAVLFARLHHDLRTPLTTILGYADLLTPDAPAEELETVREVVLRSGRHLLAMLDDAVALAEAARVPVMLAPADAGDVVRSAVDVCIPLAEEAGVALSFDNVTSAAPVLLDAALVGRVVQTLVAEALAVPGVRCVDARLSDDGSRLVFDIGVREAPRSEADRPPVALVARLVARLGGGLESVPGSGRWTVRLPRTPAVVVEMPEAAVLG